MKGIILMEKDCWYYFLLSSSSTLSLFHLHAIFIGILRTISPMHLLGFVLPRKIPSSPDSCYSWNSLSSSNFPIFWFLALISFSPLFYRAPNINMQIYRRTSFKRASSEPGAAQTSEETMG